MIPPRYLLVQPVNSTRIFFQQLDKAKIDPYVRIEATGHARSIKTFSEPLFNGSANILLTSQPTLNFYPKEWIPRHEIIKVLERHTIQDMPLSKIEIKCPSSYDGKEHMIRMVSEMTHQRMYKKKISKGEVPHKRLHKIYKEFILEFKKTKRIYKHLKASPMIMVYANPGQKELLTKEFVLGLKNYLPWMKTAFTTLTTIDFLDYEVF